MQLTEKFSLIWCFKWSYMVFCINFKQIKNFITEADEFATQQ